MPGRRIWLLAYALLSVFHLLAISMGWKWAVSLSKPFLLTLLSIWFWLSAVRHYGQGRWLLAGLVFSIFGDTFLIQADEPLFFLLGLGSFLLSHLCYIRGFLGLVSTRDGWLKRSPWVIAVLSVYLIGITIFLWPGIPAAMRIPVAIYSLVITLMMASVINLRNRLEKQVFQLILSGAILFLLSDSLIALYRFRADVAPDWSHRFLIMLTYLSGQGLIAYGSWRMLTDMNKPLK